MSVSTFRHLMDYSSPSTEQKTKELNVQREMYSSAAAEREEEIKRNELCKTLHQFISHCLSAIEATNQIIVDLLLRKNVSNSSYHSKNLIESLTTLLISILPKVFKTWKNVKNGIVQRMLRDIRSEVIQWLKTVKEKHVKKEQLSDQIICEKVADELLEYIKSLQHNINEIILMLMKCSLPKDYFCETQDEKSLRLFMYIGTPLKMTNIVKSVEDFVSGALIHSIKSSDDVSRSLFRHQYLNRYTLEWTEVNQPKISHILNQIIRTCGYQPQMTSSTISTSTNGQAISLDICNQENY